MPTGPQGSCLDSDECVDPLICDSVINSTCVNSAGSYDCSTLPDPHGVCLTGYHKCGPYGTCKVIGADKDEYSCDCVLGYELDGTGWTCVDINECDGGGDCLPEEFCKNTMGGHSCTTQDKEDPNGLCDAENNLNAVICLGTSATCAVTADKLSAYCVCPSGFYYDANKGCVDLDECLYSQMNICTVFEKCYNTFGGYTCQPHPDPLGKCEAASCDPRATCYPDYSSKKEGIPFFVDLKKSTTIEKCVCIYICT